MTSVERVPLSDQSAISMDRRCLKRSHHRRASSTLLQFVRHPSLPSMDMASPDSVVYSFIDHCRWWVHGFVPQQFSDPMRIRHTCPLLFGAVICVSSYYLDAPNGDVGLQLYLSLVALVNETLARKHSDLPSSAAGADLSNIVSTDKLPSCRRGTPSWTWTSFLASRYASSGKRRG